MVALGLRLAWEALGGLKLSLHGTAAFARFKTLTVKDTP